MCAKYYQTNKERLQKRCMKDIKTYPKKIKKKRQYGCEQYKNLSEDEKQRLADYTNIINWWKMLHSN